MQDHSARGQLARCVHPHCTGNTVCEGGAALVALLLGALMLLLLGWQRGLLLLLLNLMSLLPLALMLIGW